MSGRPIEVLIVDDSAVVRQVLTAVLERDPDLNVIGTAPDPIHAMRRMNRHWPDVVVLDVEMPRMDGITFLRELMAVRPTPVVICSTLTEKGASTTLNALSAGAVAFVTKPRVNLKEFLESDGQEIIRTVKVAAGGQVRRFQAPAPIPAFSAAGFPSGGPNQAGVPGLVPRPRAAAPLPVTTERLVAIGTSTGGTRALEVVLAAMPPVAPGIVIVQHMPEKFTAAFAARLNDMCATEVLEASDGERVLPGRALIAPGGRHLTVVRDGAQYRVRVADGPPVNRHKPSVDVLFRSVAQVAGRSAMGVIMTGMGDDGARGLREMRDAGAYTVGQDESTCVVYGMPGEAMRLGAVETEAKLTAIPELIWRFAERKGS